MEVARKSSPLSPLPNQSDFRVPPQDLEAEQSVLGAMMLSSEATRLVINCETGPRAARLVF